MPEMMTAQYVIPASTEPLPIVMVIQMLDDEIRHWRDKRAAAVEGTPAHAEARAYVDAYQCARRWLTGSVLLP